MDETKGRKPYDFAQMRRRVARVPLASDNYTGLTAIEGHLIYVKTAPFYYGRDSGMLTLFFQDAPRIFSPQPSFATVSS